MSNLIELPVISSDLVSSLHFNSSNTLLHTASWDGYVNLYDIQRSISSYKISQSVTEENSIVGRFHTGSSILDSCWDENDENIIYSGNINGQIYRLDLSRIGPSTEKVLPSGTIGTQSKLAIQKLKFNKYYNVLGSISWDKSLQISDPRSQAKSLIKHIDNKPLAMDMNNNYVIVSTTKNLIQLYDLRFPGAPLIQERESGLRFQTREILLSKNQPPMQIVNNQHIFDKPEMTNQNLVYNNEDFFVQSSYEGRIIVDFIDPSEKSQEQKFAFKCHKITSSDGIDMISPINSIILFREPNPLNSSPHQLLYTSGSDGLINLWDLNKKKKLKKLKKFKHSIMKMGISNPKGEIPRTTADKNNDHMLAIVVGEDSFKNNRYLDTGVTTSPTNLQQNKNGIGQGAMPNVTDFNTKLYLKFM
ncbi:Bub3 protein [Saccharomycopsis crataegensis]|uniref:Bub3 protein n=1 Tax=Saccharomycopsis crataegensis TaxID=43959 RepID=A0AAV5QVY6_9ASCO|nr:Bub3 protein [Saccharomycopsis crataegensis]